MLKLAYQLGVEQAYREAGIEKTALPQKLRAIDLIASGITKKQLAQAARKGVPRGIPSRLPAAPAGGPVTEVPSALDKLREAFAAVGRNLPAYA